MAQSAVVAFVGSIPLTSTVVYTGKSGKIFILKSVVVTNLNSEVRNFSLLIDGLAVASRQAVQGSGALIVPVYDQVVTAGQQIRVYAATGSTKEMNIRISGNEVDVADEPGLVSSRMTADTTYKTLSPSGTKRLIKSLVICNTTANDLKARLMVGDYSSTGWNFDTDLLTYTKIKSYQTILIPFADVVVNSNELIVATQDVGQGLNFSIVTRVVT